MNTANSAAPEQFRHAQLLRHSRVAGVDISVFENSHYRWIQTASGAIHSAMDKRQPDRPVLAYFAPMLSALLFSPSPQSVLICGLGGGELLRFLHRHYPRTALTTIENNPGMPGLFSEFFQPQPFRFRSVIDDICNIGRYPDCHDIVFVDVYTDAGLPECFHQTTFYQQLAGLLNVNGVLAINLAVNNEAQAFDLLRTLRAGFDRRTFCLQVSQHMNLVILAFGQGRYPLSIDELRHSADQYSRDCNIDFTRLLENLLRNNPHPHDRLVFY